MFAKERGIEVKLTVVKIEGWQRDMYLFDTGLYWLNPSPNMRSLGGRPALPRHRHDGVHECFGRPWHGDAVRSALGRRGSMSEIGRS